LPTRSLVALAVLALQPGCQHVAPRPLSPEETGRAFMSRSLDEPALRGFLEAALEEPLPEWPLRGWSLETLTLAALYFHPDLGVARAHAQLAGAAIRSAGARPNPTLSIAPELSTNPESGVSPWLAAIHLDWPIETAGKRRFRLERAHAAAAAARLAVSGEAWRVRRQLESVVIDWEAARGRLASLRLEVTTAEHLAGLLEERVAEGAASRGDLAPVHFVLLQASVELAAAEAASATLRARLAEALGVPEPACEGLELLEPVRPAAADLAAIQRDELLRYALLQRADVLAALADYAASEAALKLELARQYPDLHVGTGYGFDQGQNKWSLGLSIDLPLLDQNQGPIAEAEAAREEAEARFVMTQARVVSAVDLALAAREGARVQRERLARAESDRAENLESVRAAVALGALDRASELGARLEQVRAHRAVIDADAAFQEALADLDAALGAPLTGVEAPSEAERTARAPGSGS
jgi:outer membrane protein TolC